MDLPKAAASLGPRHDSASRVQKPESATDRMAALKARVNAAIGASRAKGGLNVGLHPALENLGHWKSGKDVDATSGVNNRSTADVSKPPAKKKTSITDSRSNPYLDENTSSQASSGKQRQPKPLIFNQKGKYIQQANALRKQAALEALKKRIAEQTRKAGIDDDRTEKVFLVDAPPTVEWYDEGLLTSMSYDDIEDPKVFKIGTADSIVTEFIQHPVPLEPPQESRPLEIKPLPLTAKEAAKLRRQRRGAALKEEQAKIRLGLEPAPPPKIKKANLMRVLGSEAVKDPTAVEMKVHAEIAERHQKHMQANADRQLTKEQKHEKLAANQEKDATKGLHMMVFKIGSLANGQHRYKIGKNSEQLGLTGICVMNPKFSLVVVEGGSWSIAKYRKLLLSRIDWTENVPSREKDGKQGALRQWLMAEDNQGSLKDLTSNYCTLLFEGEVKARVFKRFYSRVAETESEAREILTRVKMETFWGQAKNTASDSQ